MTITAPFAPADVIAGASPSTPEIVAPFVPAEVLAGAPTVVKVNPVFFDLAKVAWPLSGAPWTVAQALCGLKANPFPLGTLYVGLIMANTWTASTAVTLGEYAVASNPVMFATSNRHVYVCTTAGTTGASEPTWNQAIGGTTSDGTAVWTECTTEFNSGGFSGAEPSGGSYGRASFNNGPIYFYDPVELNPVIQWPVSSAAWGSSTYVAVGMFVADAATGDGATANIYAWGLFQSPVSFSASGFAAAISLGEKVPSVGVTGVLTGISTGYDEVVFTGDVAAGEVLLVGVETTNTGVTSIVGTGPANVTFTDVGRVSDATGPAVDFSWWRSAILTSSGSTTITVTTPAGGIPSGVLLRVVNLNVNTRVSTENSSSAAQPFASPLVMARGTLLAMGLGIYETLLPPTAPPLPWVPDYYGSGWVSELAWHQIASPDQPVFAPYWSTATAGGWVTNILVCPPAAVALA